MDYLYYLNIYPNDLNHCFGLIDDACTRYDINFDRLMNELYEDILNEPFGECMAYTMMKLAFGKLAELLKGHEVDYDINGRATYLYVDGNEMEAYSY